MPEMAYEYEDMSRKVLIEHCKAYSEALHKLANEIQTLKTRLFIINARGETK
ncbi:hypothetical protein CCP3SC15_6560002 [Gammaproteobacteria bacterium]